MTALQEKLMDLKKSLPRGGQRSIARTTGIHPNSVSLAFSGFIVSDEINQTILDAAEKLIKEGEL